MAPQAPMRHRGRSVAVLAACLLPAAASGEAAARELWGGFKTQMQSDKPQLITQPGMGMDGMGMGVGPASPFAPVMTPMLRQERDELAKKGEASTEMARGMIEEFLHGQKLEQGELDCLVEGTGELAGDLMVTASHTVHIIESILAYRQDPSKLQGAFPGMPGMPGGPGLLPSSGKPYKGTHGSIEVQVEELAANAKHQVYGGGKTDSKMTPSEKAEAEAQKSLGFFYGEGRRLMNGNPMLAMSSAAVCMELGFSCQQMIRLTHDIAKQCVKSDALDAFHLAAEHMKSLDILSDHIIACGEDVIVELADAVTDYQANAYRKFGEDIGKAMRKVVLACSSNNKLPEGLPSKYALANMTAGLCKGFFGDGFSLDVVTPETVVTDQPIHIDLHTCIGKNLPFFQQVWASTMAIMAQREAELGKMSTPRDGRRYSFQRDQDATTPMQSALELSTLLGFSMLGVPNALSRCNLDASKREMLMDAVKTMGRGTSFDLHTPASTMGKAEVADTMARAVKDYSKQNWLHFGKDLGLVMQELATTVFPKLYTVRDGQLRRQMELMDASEMARAGPGGGTPLMVPLALAVAVLLGAALVALKSRRTLQAWYREWNCNEAKRIATEDVEEARVERVLQSGPFLQTEQGVDAVAVE